MTPQLPVHTNLLFIGNPYEKELLPHLKPFVGGKNCYFYLSPVSTVAEIEMYCQKRKITGVISTSVPLLTKLLGSIEGRRVPSLDNYAGSLFKRNGIEYVFVHPLEQIHTVDYCSFLTRRFISKLVEPEKWPIVPAFSWNLLTATTFEEVYSLLQSAILIGIDIETSADPEPNIVCVSYTGLFEKAGELETKSYCLPIDSLYAVSCMRQLNSLPSPKVFQNGKYDNAYLTRYSAPVYNYLFDTANAFHCYYSELPKDLGFLNAFFVREAMYWKDLSSTSDLYEYYRYNCLDSWGTVNSFISWLEEAPDWSIQNYLQEFPLTFPCHLSEMTGIKRDMQMLEKVNGERKEEILKDLGSLRKMIGVPNFNPNSHLQVKQLLCVLGCKDIAEKSSDEKSIKKAMWRHPLNTRILSTVLSIRKKRKEVSTYLGFGTDDEGESLAKEFKGRILYSLNPHGTDTGRLASREHHFLQKITVKSTGSRSYENYGLNIQNQPRGPSIKQTYIADEDFFFAEVDEEKAETWDTAYIAGEKHLIEIVNDKRKDFHSYNAAKFFGKKYESIWDSQLGKVIDKELRQLAKRVNHGANYVMGAGVLLDTLGYEIVFAAGGMLKLPKSCSALDICEFLLEGFHKTYPGLRKIFYPGVVSDVVTKKMLVSATGWTRYCFGRPDRNKRDLNSYVAHVPQGLNAQRLNKAYMRVFYDIAIHPEHSKNFKLLAEIHDSVFFQFRRGHEYLVEEVRKRMEIKIDIKGYDGIRRNYTVPCSIKAGKENKGVERWSDCE